MSNPPTLVIVTSSFPISGDGSEAAGAFVADLAIELSKLMRVRVVAPGRRTEREQWHEGIEIFRYQTPDQPLSTLKLWNPADAWRILKVMRAGRSATAASLEDGSATHILALWALPCGEWARYCARKYDVDYSVWTLGSDIWSLGRIPIVKSFLRRVLQNARHCWSDGLKLAEDTKAIAGREVDFLPSTRQVMRARIEPLRTAPPYRLLFLGRWHVNKGADLLLEAIDLLNEDDWKRIEVLHICGGGPEQKLIESSVQRLKAAGRPVVLKGFLDRNFAEGAIASADWLLIPSRIESIPIIFSDAMKLQCPVVAMPVGDIPALLAQKPGGILSENLNAHSFHKAIKAALHSSPCQLSNGMTELATQFDLPEISLKIHHSLVGHA